MQFSTTMKVLVFMTGKKVEFDKKDLAALKMYLPLFAQYRMQDLLMIATDGNDALIKKLMESANFEQSLHARISPEQSLSTTIGQEVPVLEATKTKASSTLYENLYPLFNVLFNLETFNGDDDEKQLMVEMTTQNFSKLLVHQHDIASALKNYFKKFVNEGSDHPLQDLCNFQFTGSTAYADQWLHLLEKYGPRFAKKILPIADQIEAYCETHGMKLPHDKKSIDQLALMSFYERAKEDLEFASECFKHKIPDDAFSLALDVYAKEGKKEDRLPNIMVDGKKINLKRFVLKKLPCLDKRGFILGKFTDCCQHIAHEMGKDASIAGMTSMNSGFYTIFKLPSASSSGVPEIIAQSWAWLSKEGYLVFDSWEFRREQDMPMLVPFLEAFVKQLPPEIKGVYIGASGGTPKDLPYPLLTENLPEPIEKTGFRDSLLSQWCVLSPTLEKRDELQQ